MLIEECPIIGVNVRVWLFWSYLRRPRLSRFLVGCIPVAVLNVFQFLKLYSSWGDMSELIINGYFTVLYFNLVLRTSFLVINRRKFETFFEGVAAEYALLEKNDDIRPVLERYTRRGRMLSISNLWLGAFISACFVTYPLFVPGRGLPYGVTIPGVDVLATPTYQVVFVLQVYLTFPACCMYIPFTSFYATCTLFALVQIAALKQRLGRLGRHSGTMASTGHSAGTLFAELKECLKYHKQIIQYVHDLNSLVTHLCLLEFLSFGMMLCALLFLLSISNQLAQMIMIGSYIFMILSQMFAFYWHANEVLEQSLGIGDAIYNGAWPDFEEPIRKRLILIIARAQRPMVIKVGNVYPMTLEMFQKLLNVSYSYFTLLRRVYN
ncbi:AGAP009519-PA [Anopheles gambiae str. PEST]|uniref:Odorant receptor Or2 n=1 Tax=Anopheles gambiae TaxID=7165 RepID=OR2_ANOGA|nr:RecName: Full=Odorant receptor Or2; AltName: Full=AgOr2 [Anopheles gambiae]AAL35507.1 putative odorant receptor Or2 [Anopheles gambiae]ACH95386.1 odorant receptor 2 [Anopheles gambiae]EAA05926.1 AGAP009519-PA [Anopheles gambiae str. PEST]